MPRERKRARSSGIRSARRFDYPSDWISHVVHQELIISSYGSSRTQGDPIFARTNERHSRSADLLRESLIESKVEHFSKIFESATKTSRTVSSMFARFRSIASRELSSIIDDLADRSSRFSDELLSKIARNAIPSRRHQPGAINQAGYPLSAIR